MLHLLASLEDAKFKLSKKKAKNNVLTDDREDGDLRSLKMPTVEKIYKAQLLGQAENMKNGMKSTSTSKSTEKCKNYVFEIAALKNVLHNLKMCEKYRTPRQCAGQEWLATTLYIILSIY